MLGSTPKKEAYRIVFWQLVLIMGLALVVFIFQGIRSGLSAMAGGVAYWLPTLLFVYRVFANASARTAKKFIILFMTGEVGKLVLSAILFLVVVNYLPVNVPFALIGFVGAVVSFWIAALLLLGKGVSE